MYVPYEQICIANPMSTYIQVVGTTIQAGLREAPNRETRHRIGRVEAWNWDARDWIHGIGSTWRVQDWVEKVKKVEESKKRCRENEIF